jgi:hypothetical protein
MNLKVLLTTASLATMVLACNPVPDAPRPPIGAPTPVTLPTGLTTCNLLGAVDGGATCRVYDTQRFNFSDTPPVDAGPDDALARRVFDYERWLDLYNAPEKEVVVRNMSRAMLPTDPESVFGDDQYLALNDDHGDSAGFGGRGMNAALFHYAVTGTDADRSRLEDWVRGSVRQWDATGIDGYMARFHYAGVAPGTKLKNGYAMNVRDPNDNNAFDIPAAALPKMPAYYQTGIDINGVLTPVQPSWEGHTSIDAYSGPMYAWPLAYDHLRDAALRKRMVRHYSCFLKRLHVFKIINLSQNASLQSSVRQYLAMGALNQDADEPDLTKLDEIWGFYVSQYNHASAATFDTTCPDHLAFDAAPGEIIDAASPHVASDLFLFFLRQADTADQKNSIDFAYFPSARAGDAMFLLAYAEGAYHMTGDTEFLKWRDEMLISGTNALGIARTTGSLIPPKACRSYYRDPNTYTAWFMRTELLGDQPDARAEAVYDWTHKLRGKEEVGLRDTLFTIYTSGAEDSLAPGMPDAMQELYSFGGTKERLDSPRRNYSTDLTVNTPAGITLSTPPAADITFCDTPISLLGISIPSEQADPHALYTSSAPPVMDRAPDNWIWEKDPFQAQRLTGAGAGTQQYPGLDLLEPYWAARYFKDLPDSHLILVWGATQR